jgi:hypothetical protein
LWQWQGTERSDQWGGKNWRQRARTETVKIASAAFGLVSEAWGDLEQLSYGAFSADLCQRLRTLFTFLMICAAAESRALLKIIPSKIKTLLELLLAGWRFGAEVRPGRA